MRSFDSGRSGTSGGRLRSLSMLTSPGIVTSPVGELVVVFTVSFHFLPFIICIVSNSLFLFFQILHSYFYLNSSSCLNHYENDPVKLFHLCSSKRLLHLNLKDQMHNLMHCNKIIRITLKRKKILLFYSK